MTEPNAFQTRKLVLKLCQYLSDRHFDQLPSLFTESSTWTVLVNRRKTGYGGTHPALEHVAGYPTILGPFDTFTFDAVDVVVEGRKAVVDVIISGSGPGTTKYENEYLMWVVVDEKAEKIESVKQSLDPYEVEAWIESKKHNSEVS